MYRYDAIDRALVTERVAQFRDQTQRYLAGSLSEDEFKLLRLRNGLYIQRHAPMLRIAIPYGLLSSLQLRTLAHLADRYDRGYGHFTTRQNLQLNWPRLEDVPDILAELAEVEMHAIQTSGNCIRNITSDPLAGVAADELADPRPWCELVRQWSTLHPEFSYLPRKFKIAISGSSADRAATEVHDIGLRLVVDAWQRPGFEVRVGGGLGRAPAIGRVIREYLPAALLLRYLDAILRVYNLHGRRDNIHRARIKMLVKSLGIDAFRAQVEAEFAALEADAVTVPLVDDAEVERMRGYFPLPPYARLAPVEVTEGREPAFAAWHRYNTSGHRVPGYRVVVVSLKAHGQPPGDATSDQMRRLADIAERYSFAELRATHDQNIVLADVPQRHLHELWVELADAELATPNIGMLTDMIACPGLDFCSLANAGTLDVARQIQAQFDDFDELYDLGPIELKMSGCMNACGHHHVGHIGLLGVEKHGAEWYQITLGGSAGRGASLGEVIGPSVPKAAVPATLVRILERYVEERSEDERFIDTVRRIGVEPFRERAYAPDPAGA